MSNYYLLLTPLFHSQSIDYFSDRLLPQLQSSQLARRGARQLVAKLDPAWILVRRHSRLDEFLQLICQGRTRNARILQHDERLRLHQRLRVRRTDHCGLTHLRMFQQPRLDLEGRYPDTADLEHVVRAARKVTVALGVAHILVAGLQPPTDKRAAGRFAIVPVAGADRGSAAPQVSDLAVSR